MRALAEPPVRAAAPARPVLARAPADVARVRQLQRTAGNRATRRLLQRQVVAPVKPQPKVTPGGDDNRIEVELPDGSRHRVTRRVKARKVVDPGRLRADLCSDSKRVFLRVAWCQGTKGTIDIGANPQGALEDLVQKIGKDVMAGKGAQDVINTVKDAQVQPFAEVDIIRSRDWRISANIELDVNRTGVLGGKAGVTFDKGWIKIGAKGQAGEGGPGGTLTVEIPLGGQAPKADCKPQTVELLWEYTCERWGTSILRVPQSPLAHHDPGAVAFYFDYEKAELAAKGPTAEANAAERARLQQMLNDGFVVTGVEGFTSPEGKRELLAPAPSGFPGNQPLSEQRAVKARDQAIAHCSILRTRCADAATPATGRGEKLGLEEDVGGSRLERAVVAQFTGDETELARLPADERAFITDERNGLHARAERIYPWLRRAEIALVHDWSEPRPDLKVPITGFEPEQACPVEVEQAADGHWGSRVPLTGPEPSICKT